LFRRLALHADSGESDTVANGYAGGVSPAVGRNVVYRQLSLLLCGVPTGEKGGRAFDELDGERARSPRPAG
jgi:hypothetical protein